MKSLSRLLAITKKEIRQMRRDRLTFGMIVGIPVIQMLLFGYAINTDVRNLRTAVVDQANTHLSRQFVEELRETQVVDIVARADTPAQLEELMRLGEISVGVVVPADFGRRVIDRNRPAVHLLVDGSDPTILGVANQLRAMPLGFGPVATSSQEAGNLPQALQHADLTTGKARLLDHKIIEQGVPHRECHRHDECHGQQHGCWRTKSAHEIYSASNMRIISRRWASVGTGPKLAPMLSFMW